ncbi:MAG: radical SAM additional 4Fe4S-binding SPASM domain-containing protein [Candidatus Kentron sp. G]|nr:MAG: radical SAM additional 4Fe4S-binding SPASM domain-containing protein [Candidatus Kentron sp. G]VFN00213.1 MAG: radical SAM additional 4Fe4S-binding SPASM domain-containing protein [Candidatus Kentron sp. G]VFN02397.1 MAG: radical SAM additional 4Fe4S-binding SPASM domain-containing protein [Candidatus Kentron sp. G]
MPEMNIDTPSKPTGAMHRPAGCIGVMSYRACDQACRQCSYVEPVADQARPRNSRAEIDFIRLVRRQYPGSEFFLYPREITTAVPLLPVMQEIGQSETLTNGNHLTASLVERMCESGLKRVQITLFGTAAEQEFYNGNSPEEFERIKANIRLCVERGLRVQVNNVLFRETMNSIEALGDECLRLGVDRIRFLRLLPIGHANDAFSPHSYLTQVDLEDVIIPAVERLKLKYGPRIYLCFAVNFGPNFHGKTPEQAREKIRRRSQTSPPSDTFCLAIDGGYWIISTQSGNVHWCFHNISGPDTRIGKVNWETGRVMIDRPVDLSRETLRRKLRGICAAEACRYQEVCLGGCRNAAISFASDGTTEDRFYAGMDMCLTLAYARYHARRNPPGLT